MPRPVRTGSPVSWFSANASGSQPITVPADAQLIVLGISGYKSSTGFFSGQPPQLAGTPIGIVLVADTSIAYFQGDMFLRYLPPVGAQTITWNWGALPDNRVLFCAAFYKGIAPNWLGDGYAGQSGNSNHATDTLIATANDLIVAVHSPYIALPGTAPAWNWTNATQVQAFNDGLYTGLSLAEAQPTGNVVISVQETTYQSDNALCAVVIQGAAGGASGDLAATQGQQTLAATGSVPITATLAATQAPNTLAATQDFPPATGDVAATQGPQTLAATAGAVPTTGDLAATQDAQTLAATQDFPPTTGDLAATQDAQTLAATQDFPPTAGDIAATQDAQTLAATQDFPPTAGDIAATQGTHTFLATDAVIGPATEGTPGHVWFAHQSSLYRLGIAPAPPGETPPTYT